MNDSVSVKIAIQKGLNQIGIPSYLIFFGILGVSIYLKISQNLSGWVIGLGILLGIIFCWLYWSLTITKWRIWAFSNVRNVHKLKKEAVLNGLIHPEGSIFEKTEIRSEEEKIILKILEKKFLIEDIFHDDINIPKETKIFYSKIQNLFDLIGMLLFFCLSSYLIIDGKIGLGIVSTICFGYFSKKEFDEYTNREPQIIINDKGLKTINTKFYSWKRILNEQVVSKGTGTNIKFYLSYIHPQGSENLQIDEYNIYPDELKHLLEIYRGRNKKGSKRK